VGGQELSTYPDWCRLSIERRTIPGESTSEVEEQVTAILERASATDPTFRAEQRTVLVRDSFGVAPDEPIVRLAQRQLTRVLGREPAITGQGGWMDSAFLASAGIPTVVFGPDGAGLHADVEWVDLPSAVRTAEALLGCIEEFCA
jgi:acetylornithine deacetylase